MLELSLDYLTNSPLYSQVHSVKELSETLSRDFKILSKSLLNNEDRYKTISKEQQEKSLIIREEITEKILNPMTSHLFNEIQELDFEYNELKKLNLTRQIKINRERRKKIYKEYQQLLIDYSKMKQELPVKIKKISNLQETFRHIDSYFSSKNSLEENPNMTHRK